MKDDPKTQINKILEHLKKGYSLTPLEALRRFGCFRLAAVIHRLKKIYRIETHMVKDGKKTYASYRMFMARV